MKKKENKLDLSELASNLSSCTEIEKEIGKVKATSLRQSRRLAKPTQLLNNTIQFTKMITGNTAKGLNLSPLLETTEKTPERDSEENH